MLKLKKLIYISVILLLACSGPITEEETELTYDETIAQGWTSFTNQNFSSAINSFTTAKSKDGNRYEAFLGLGWSYLLIDDYNQSIIEFNSGVLLKSDLAELHAGLALSLNARNGSGDLNNSILSVDAALAIDANWQFEFGLSLVRNTLLVIKAQNQYLLGNYSGSLATIQLIDSAFTADITSAIGKNALAGKIESYNPGIN